MPKLSVPPTKLSSLLLASLLLLGVLLPASLSTGPLLPGSLRAVASGAAASVFAATPPDIGPMVGTGPHLHASLQPHPARLDDFERHAAPLDLRHGAVVAELYARRGNLFAWIDPAASAPHLSAHGRRLLALLEDGVRVHGLWSDELRLTEIEPLLEALASRRAVGTLDASAERRDRLARLELLLSDGLAAYAFVMRASNPAWQRGIAWPDALDASEREAYMLRRALRPVFEDPASLERVAASLAPPFAQYAALTQAYVRYGEIAADGGWEALPAAAQGLRRGQKQRHVVALKRRLAIEGFYDPEETSTSFGPRLEEALRTYQRARHAPPSGWLDATTRGVLNEPVEERLHQLRLGLQRWRESKIGADTHYVLVNIPDFHIEVWEPGGRALRMKAVVGARGAPTRLFSDTIQFVVFNPYWNVPKRLRERDLEPRQRRDPSYFDRAGFEVVEHNGERFVRQRPGPRNAMGRVKILFPNDHAIYLHDTPDTHLFDRTLRARSNGCVRVEDALELARYLMRREGWTDEEYEQRLEAWIGGDGEQWVRLENPLPIHFEYHSVRVDDVGRVHFLTDIYRYDRPRLEEIRER